MIAKIKLIAIGLLALLMLIVVLQNTAMVKTKFLFVEISMPRAALLGITLGIGFALGFLAAGWVWRAKKKEK